MSWNQCTFEHVEYEYMLLFSEVKMKRNFIILYTWSLADKRPCVASLHAYTQLKWPINDRPCLSVSVYVA